MLLQVHIHVGNELQEFGEPFDSWTETIAQYIKEELGAQQLIMDGRAQVHRSGLGAFLTRSSLRAISIHRL